MSAFLYGMNLQANSIRQHVLRYGGRGQPLLLIPSTRDPWTLAVPALAEIIQLAEGRATTRLPAITALPSP